MTDHPINDPLRIVLDRLEGVKRTGQGQYMARCPAHDDRHASLSVGVGQDGRVLLDCKAGCAVGEVVKALGMKVSDLFAAPPATLPRPVPRRAPAKKARKAGATYRAPEDAFAAVARAVKGECVGQWSYPGDTFRVGRFDLHAGGKTYRPIRRAGNAWTLGDLAGALPLYRGDELPDDEEAVVVVEGEKCADAARAVGLFAVASAHGAKSAAKTDFKPLAGRKVIILPDHDDTGRQYADEVAAILHRLKPPAVVKIVELPGLGEHGDFADWTDADGAMGCKDAETIKAAVLSLVEAAEPWTPAGSIIEPAPVVSCLADVQAEPVKWFWPSRIALGKLTLIAGDPGLGKSFITLDMAARTSRGTPWPDCPEKGNVAGGVVLLSAEDDLADTIRPRLDAAGADVRRIVALQAVRRVDIATKAERQDPFNLADDLPALERAIRDVPDCRLVIIDPISAYLGKTESHKNADIRGLLAPLSALAARHHVAVVCVTHLRKGEGPAMYRAMGSLAFVAAARAVFAVTKDREDPTGQRRFLLPVKNNLGNDRDGLAYRLDDTFSANGQAVVKWEADPVDVSADEALRPDRPAGTSADSSELDEAKVWLSDALADGPLPAKDILARSRQDGISKRTLNRAKKVLNVTASKVGFKAGWTWHLPGTPAERKTEDAGDADQDEDGQDEEHQAPKQKTLATFGELGDLRENPKESGGPDGPEPAAPEECQPSEPGNLRLAPPADLDPDRPGPVDRLPADRLPTYKAVYYSRSADMPPAERHRRAWRAALRRA